MPEQIAPKEIIEWFIQQYRWPNNVMYHYTSRAALENILRTRQMWATDLRAMNDPDELLYGRRMIHDVIRRAARHRRNEVKTAFLRSFEQAFWPVIAGPSTSFSISFSEHPDLPGQWRKYAENGSGFALGWSIDDLCPETPLRIWVTYSRAKQQQLVGGLIDLHLKSMAHLYGQGNAPADAAAAAGLSLSRFVDAVWQTFKGKKWENESEFRFVYQFFSGHEPAGQVFKTRFAGDIEKRYIEADFSRVELRRVIVGPENDVPTTVTWLRRLLDQTGFRKTPVVLPVVSRDQMSEE
jgi:hypothetical protein